MPLYKGLKLEKKEEKLLTEVLSIFTNLGKHRVTLDQLLKTYAVEVGNNDYDKESQPIIHKIIYGVISNETPTYIRGAVEALKSWAPEKDRGRTPDVRAKTAKASLLGDDSKAITEEKSRQ